MKKIKYRLMYFLASALLMQSGCEKMDFPVIIEESDPITDIDGNVYKTVNIGNQKWIIENLNVSYFRNGDPIPEAKTNAEWELAGTEGKPAWCYYNQDPGNASTYGKLYNWYAVNDPRGLDPEGWRVPSTKEWAKLIDYLEGEDIAGIKLKSTSGWDSDGNGDNSSKFTGLPGGGRLINGDFSDIGRAGIWWSASENTAISAYAYNLGSSNSKVIRGYFDKGSGLSVRSVYCPTCTNDTTSALTFSEKLQRALDVSLESGNGIGVSAAVIMPDGKTWIGVSGVSYGTTLITPDMLFAIGSTQKMFVGTAILQLAEEGKINVDDSLYKWLPPYPFVDSTITIRQLLNHTSGLYNFVDNEDFWQAVFIESKKVWTMEELFLSFNREPLFPKGTNWHYSQTGYNMLRMIIKNITGSDIPEVNNDRFWIPLGLTNSFTSRHGELPAVFAHGWYDLDGNGSYDDFSSFSRTAFVSGIGGEIWSTAEDLAKWVQALFYDKKVLSQASLDQMLTFYSPCTGEEFLSAGYGLSVVKFNPQIINGLEAIGHSGNAPGYSAACLYFPEYEVCIALADNTEEGESIGVSLNNLLNVITGYLEENQ
ncbi:serine hydrolase [Bacteroidota bacterium]